MAKRHHQGRNLRRLPIGTANPGSYTWCSTTALAERPTSTADDLKRAGGTEPARAGGRRVRKRSQPAQVARPPHTNCRDALSRAASAVWIAGCLETSAAWPRQGGLRAVRSAPFKQAVGGRMRNKTPSRSPKGSGRSGPGATGVGDVRWRNRQRGRVDI